LLLADMAVIDKKLDSLNKKKSTATDELKQQIQLLTKCKETANDGKLLSSIPFKEEEKQVIRGFQLLTSKPFGYILNVDDASVVEGNRYTKIVEEHFNAKGSEVTPFVCISATLEQEVGTGFDTLEAQLDYLKVYGLLTPSVDAVVRMSSTLLNQHWFYTVGPEESRAWEIRCGSTALEAAGKIHSDIAKGFIYVEVKNTEEFLRTKGECASVRQGKDYIVKDGDIMLFKFNVATTKAAKTR